MAQHKVYTSNAERQKAYRERLKGSPVASPMKKIRISRPISKPKRLQALLAEAEDLLQKYQEWELPENLQDSVTAQKLQDTVDALEQVVELLENIEVPRGFGRD